MTANGPEISAVIPLYNEAESLPELHTALAASLLPYADRWEVVFVDDGSTDDSFEVLKTLRELVSFGLLAEMIVYGSNRESDPPVDVVLK